MESDNVILIDTINNGYAVDNSLSKMTIRDLNMICTFTEPPTSVQVLLLADLQQLETRMNSH
ncbi:hypothetical protein Gotur_027128 [Gossypium turneri]